MARRLLGLIPLAIFVVVMLRIAMVGSGFDRVLAIVWLVVCAGLWAWMRFTSSGQKAFASFAERLKRKD